MTITPTAPAVTPCPVDWCSSAGHHEWDCAEHVAPLRIHQWVAMSIPTGYGRDMVVAAEVHEEDQLTPTVDLYNAESLHSREQVEQVIAALRQAADLAFGPAEGLITPDTPRAGLPRTMRAAAELDAAIAEVITRAGNPTDINRLVAAVVRLRTANDALVAAEVAEVIR